jgi:hypothetical protein
MGEKMNTDVKDLPKQNNSQKNENHKQSSTSQKTATITSEEFYLTECFQQLKDIKLEKK